MCMGECTQCFAHSSTGLSKDWNFDSHLTTFHEDNLHSFPVFPSQEINVKKKKNWLIIYSALAIK